MTFLIYGAGALGQALGCMLASAGYGVDMILRRRFIGSIEQNGLTVDGVLGDYRVPAARIGLYDTLAVADGEYEYVLVTTKSYDTAAAIGEIAALQDRAHFVVSMQNGCGNIEQLKAAFGGERALAGRVITGFEIVSPGHVHVSVTADAIHIGGSCPGTVDASAVRLAEMITEAGHPCTAVEDINQSLSAKLLYNCALNPLGALLGLHYGALADSKETRSVMEAIIRETFAVVTALGTELPWAKADEYIEYFYEKLLPPTWNHRASMLQDLENGKPTEVAALTGYVSERGRALSIATPTCDCLTALVRFREQE